MVLSYEAFSCALGADPYKSFTGYQIPPKLQGPIAFAKTERLVSFYLARHDGGRLLWFAKILVEKQSSRPWRSVVPRAPGSLLFFEVKMGAEALEPGRPIDYPATEHRNEYFEVEVDASGREGRAELLRRKVFFADLYTYRPNGTLRQRKLVRTDESFSMWRYDNHGNVIEQAEERSGGFFPAELLLMGIPANGAQPPDGRPAHPDEQRSGRSGVGI